MDTGIIELKASTSATEFEAVDIAFRMIMGLSLTDDSDRRVDGPPSVFRPPCLTYYYVPEVSVIYDKQLKTSRFIILQTRFPDDSRLHVMSVVC